MSQRKAMTIRLSDTTLAALAAEGAAQYERPSVLAAQQIEAAFHDARPVAPKPASKVERVQATVPLAADHVARVDHIAALRNTSRARVIAHLISDGVAIEFGRRMRLERSIWPPLPADSRAVPFDISPLSLCDLVEISETAFEPLDVTTAAMFQLGLAKYEAEHDTN